VEVVLPSAVAATETKEEAYSLSQRLNLESLVW
jgi:hypothetical protein